MEEVPVDHPEENASEEEAVEKLYVDITALRTFSFLLAKMILEGEFYPDFMIALWRGGASIGMYTHEMFNWMGLNTDHIAIRTSKYHGIDQASETVEVHNLGYAKDRLTKATKLLIVDDIFDTGRSIEAVIKNLRTKLGENMPDDFRVATVFYKPDRNQTNRIPDYYIGSCKVAKNIWVVFPHEVEGMDLAEIYKAYGYATFDIFQSLVPLRPRIEAAKKQ